MSASEQDIINGSDVISPDAQESNCRRSSNKEIAATTSLVSAPTLQSVGKSPEEDLASFSREPATDEIELALEEELINMIPRSESKSNMAVVTTSSHSPGKDGRANSAGSLRSPLLSMEMFLRPEDVALDGGLFLSSDGPIVFTTSDEAKLRITTSDFVKDVILAEERHNSTMESLPSIPTEAAHRCCPMLELTEKLGRITTGDSMGDDIMSENFKLSSREWVEDLRRESSIRVSAADDIMTENIRLSSREWVDEFRESSMRSIDPDLFVEGPEGISYGGYVVVPPWSAPVATMVTPHQAPYPQYDDDFDEYEIPFDAANHLIEITSAPSPPLSDPLPSITNTPTSSSQPSTPTTSLLFAHQESSIASPSPSPSPSIKSYHKSKSTSSTSTTKSKKRRKRIIDESHVCQPTENDVLFGRGGFTNTHPGNIKFRKTALELRSWYEQSSKEEKFKISDLLVESVKSEGHRFLERGSDGLWHEVIGNGARKKASQALRERVKRSSGGNRDGRGGLGSSLNSAGSQVSQELQELDVEEEV